MTDDLSSDLGLVPGVTETEMPLPPSRSSPPGQESRRADLGGLVVQRSLTPQSGADGSCGCGGGGGPTGPQGFAYAIGATSARFPSQSLEREFLQVWSPTRYDGPIPQSVIYEVLSQGQNLYLAREMCWVFSSQGVDLFLVQPRSYVELTDLIMSLAPSNGERDWDLVVGSVGPIAPGSYCNGLQLPVVAASQVFTFTENAFLENIVAYAAAIGKTVTIDAARNAFNILIQLTDNAGMSNEHRAINYVTFKSVDLYVLETQMEGMDPRFQLTDVSARPSSLSGARQIVDVIFIYANTVTTEVQQFFTRVDVTGMFPFLVTPIQRFYDRP